MYKDMLSLNRALMPNIPFQHCGQSWLWTTFASMRSPFNGEQLNQAGRTYQREQQIS